MMRVLLGSLLAFQVAVHAEESEWSWGWSDLDSLQKHVQDSIHEHTEKLKDKVNEKTEKLKDKVNEHTEKLKDKVNENTEKLKDKVRERTAELKQGIEDYKQVVEDYADALKDASFKKAVLATGICKHLPEAEELSAPEIEGGLPSPMTGMEEDPGEVPEGCEAAADEVTAEEIKKQLKEGEASETVDKFMKLIVQRSSASLCQGEAGIKDWLKESSGLRETDPEKYKEEVKKQLKGKVGPILKTYSSKFCGEEEEEEERLFALGSGPLIATVEGRGAAAASLLALVAVALLSLGVLAVRRAARRAQAHELEPLAAEDAAEEGLDC